MHPAVTGADVLAAQARLRSHVRHTPMQRCRSISEWVGRPVLFKCENFQTGGSFKVRGALNAVACLPPEDRARGVLTHSSGNFAQGLALAARALKTRATIVMPSNAPAVKQAAVQGYGAEVVLCAPTLHSRIQTVEALAAESGGTIISPSDHPDVIAGQGTCALELLTDAPNLSAVVVPLGGGGLLSGIAVAIKHLAPHIVVLGAEPTGADDAWRSRQAGHRVGHPPSGPDTICDGLRTELGQYTWPIVRDLVDEVIRVPDADTRLAMRWLMERAKLVVEPSAAIALAALLQPTFPAECDGPVGIVLSGGNLDLGRLSALFD